MYLILFINIKLFSFYSLLSTPLLPPAHFSLPFYQFNSLIPHCDESALVFSFFAQKRFSHIALSCLLVFMC